MKDLQQKVNKKEAGKIQMMKKLELQADDDEGCFKIEDIIFL